MFWEIQTGGMNPIKGISQNKMKNMEKTFGIVYNKQRKFGLEGPE